MVIINDVNQKNLALNIEPNVSCVGARCSPIPLPTVLPDLMLINLSDSPETRCQKVDTGFFLFLNKRKSELILCIYSTQKPVQGTSYFLSNYVKT